MIVKVLLGLAFVWISDATFDFESIRNPDHVEFPELPTDADCIPGRTYRSECNTCRCGPKNSLICTKMSCLTQKNINKVKDTVRKQKELERQKKETENLKADKSKGRTVNWYPELPEGKCVPGKLYQKNCRGCFCDFDRTALCVNHKNVCDKNFYPESADEIRPQLSQAELDVLPTLPHIAAKCKPGKSYRVDCNSCVCLINHSLMCDMAMCLSYEDMHKKKAESTSNKNCTKGEEIQSPNQCIKCTCTKKGKTKCELIPGCMSDEEMRRSLHGGKEKYKPRLNLEIRDKEKCASGIIYKFHCNRCFCQDDGSLRCTQKTCLQYAQTLQIKKHKLYLQKHGL